MGHVPYDKECPCLFSWKTQIRMICGRLPRKKAGGIAARARYLSWAANTVTLLSEGQRRRVVVVHSVKNRESAQDDDR